MGLENTASEERDFVSKKFDKVSWGNTVPVTVAVREVSPDDPFIKVSVTHGMAGHLIGFPSLEGLSKTEVDQILSLFANTSLSIINELVAYRIKLMVDRKFRTATIRKGLSRKFKYSEVQLTFIYHLLSHRYEYPDELIDWIIDHEEEMYAELLDLMAHNQFMPFANPLATLFSKFLADENSVSVKANLAVEHGSTSYLKLQNYFLDWLFNDDLSVTLSETMDKPMNLDKVSMTDTIYNNISVSKFVKGITRTMQSMNVKLFNSPDEDLHKHFKLLMNLTAFEMLVLMNFANYYSGSSMANELPAISFLVEQEEVIIKNAPETSKNKVLEQLTKNIHKEINQHKKPTVHANELLQWAIFFSCPGRELFGKGLMKPIIQKLEESGEMNDLKIPGALFYGFDMPLFSTLVEWRESYDNGSNIPVTLFRSMNDFDVSEHVKEWEDWLKNILLSVNEKAVKENVLSLTVE